MSALAALILIGVFAALVYQLLPERAIRVFRHFHLEHDPHGRRTSPRNASKQSD